MYKRIEAAMVLSGISKKELAHTIGITYNTLLLKLKGEAVFTLDEAFKVRNLFDKSIAVDEMFSRSPQQSA